MNQDELPTTCPYCGRMNDLHGDAAGTDATPSPGDSSLCWECFNVSIFAEDLSLRLPTAKELKELDGTIKALRAIRSEVYTPSEMFRLLSESGWSS